MKRLIIVNLLLAFGQAAWATDAPCQFNIDKSQGQIIKATANPKDMNLERILNQPSPAFPAVEARVKQVADRVQNKPKKQEKSWAQNGENQNEETPASQLGSMFDLLIPAKLRNPAR